MNTRKRSISGVVIYMYILSTRTHSINKGIGNLKFCLTFTHNLFQMGFVSIGIIRYFYCGRRYLKEFM